MVQMNKKILFVVAGAIATISMLVLMILDLILVKDVVYNDGWGTSFEVNNDYLCFFIVSLAFLIYGIYSLLSKKYDTKLQYYAMLTVVSSILCFYSIGSFLKSFFKALKKDVKFELINLPNYTFSNLAYLFIGLAGIGMLIYSIYCLVKVVKKED
jgi:hypothetical protein